MKFIAGLIIALIPALGGVYYFYRFSEEAISGYYGPDPLTERISISLIVGFLFIPVASFVGGIIVSAFRK